jgi:hypothetical protein
MAMNNRLMRPKATAAAAPPAATALYFSSQEEYNLAWELTNWFQNAACTIPATALPTAADDVVFLTDANNLDAPAIFECRNLTATGVTLQSFYEMKIVAAGVVTLSNVFLLDVYLEAASIVATDNCAGDGLDYAVNLQASASISLTDFVDSGVVFIEAPDVQLFGSGEFFDIAGSVTFNGTTFLGGQSYGGDATFNDSSINDRIGYYDSDYWTLGVEGNATFNDDSENRGRVGGNATFNDNSVNAFVVFDAEAGNFVGVQGNATFNGASNNYGIVEGTITCNTTGVCSVAVSPTLWKVETISPMYHWST